MPHLKFDPDATSKRRAAVGEYFKRERLVSDSNPFDCKSQSSCKASVADGCVFQPPRPTLSDLIYIGNKYDLMADSVALRVLFVGKDPGRNTPTQAPFNLNAHYRGIVKALMEIFQEKYGRDERQGWEELLERCAQTNEVRCAAPWKGSMRSNRTETMKTNCWEHFREEIRLLEPTLIFFHGADLKRPFLARLRSEGHKLAFPIKGREDYCQSVAWGWESAKNSSRSILVFFNHPAVSPNTFFRQWDVHVAPLMSALRRNKLLPTTSDSWVQLKATDWPIG